MKIQVLGTGCKTCQKLHENVLTAVRELTLDAEVEYVTDVQKIIELGLLQTPVLLIPDKDPMVGQVPSVEEIKVLLTT